MVKRRVKGGDDDEVDKNEQQQTAKHKKQKKKKDFVRFSCLFVLRICYSILKLTGKYILASHGER